MVPYFFLGQSMDATHWDIQEDKKPRRWIKSHESTIKASWIEISVKLS